MKPCLLEEHQIASLLLKVVEILNKLHSQGKVHKDVTIGNITLSEPGKVKLVDAKAVSSILQMVPEVDKLIMDDQKVSLHGFDSYRY